jgi:hypothetical protein
VQQGKKTEQRPAQQGQRRADPQPTAAGQPQRSEQESAGQRRPPVLVEGIAPEEDQRILLDDHPPAGAGSQQRTAALRIRLPVGTQDAPLEDVREQHAGGNENGQRRQRVSPAIQEWSELAADRRER